jgi:hypothetical protein
MVTSTISRRQLSRLLPLVKFQSLPVMQLWHLGCLSVDCRKTTHSEDGYGTGNRVLHSVAVSQASEVDPGGPAGQVV